MQDRRVVVSAHGGPEVLQVIEPLVAARVPLREEARADELLEAGGRAGKVVLVTDA